MHAVWSSMEPIMWRYPRISRTSWVLLSTYTDSIACGPQNTHPPFKTDSTVSMGFVHFCKPCSDIFGAIKEWLYCSKATIKRPCYHHHLTYSKPTYGLTMCLPLATIYFYSKPTVDVVFTWCLPPRRRRSPAPPCADRPPPRARPAARRPGASRGGSLERMIWVPSGYVKKLLKMTIEIVDYMIIPLKMVDLSIAMLVYQRVFHPMLWLHLGGKNGW